MTRRVGIEVFYWLDAWSDDQSSVFGKAAEAGYDGVEISFVAGVPIDIARVAAAAVNAGVDIVCSTGLTPHMDISSPDPDVRDAGRRHLHQSLNYAAELGSPLLGGVTYASWMGFPADDLGERRKRSAEVLGELGDVAEDLGLSICLEVLNRFEGYMFNTVSGCLAFIDSIGHSSIKVELDTFHMNMEEDDLAAAVLLAGAKLGHVQVAANNRRAPQFGHIDWPPFRTALDSVGYQGWVVFETFPNAAVETGRTTYAWRDLAVDLDGEAADAARYIREYIA